MENKAIKNWLEDERPREKLIKHGAYTLSDSELLAIILNKGRKDKSAVGLAREILDISNNNLNALARKSYKELQKIAGVGPAKAVSILATMEIGKRRQLKEHEDASIGIHSSKDMAQLLIPILKDYTHEVFYVIYLDQKNAILHREIVSKGGVSSTLVDVRIILKTALDHLASSIIISHNHPSHNVKPSYADRKLTRSIQEACGIMNMKLLDHIIIGGDKYLSFADEGIL